MKHSIDYVPNTGESNGGIEAGDVITGMTSKVSAKAVNRLYKVFREVDETIGKTMNDEAEKDLSGKTHRKKTNKEF